MSEIKPTPAEFTAPQMTPEQEATIDHLVDQGFNYTEARLRAGAVVVEQTVGLEPAAPSFATAPPQPASNKGGSDRRKLTPRQRLLADEPPAHIHDSLPYPR